MAEHAANLLVTPMPDLEPTSTAPTATPTPAEPPEAVTAKVDTDIVPPAVWGPLVDLLRSRKAVVMLAAVIGTLVLVGMGRITIEQAGHFLAVVVPAWMASHALENMGANK